MTTMLSLDAGRLGQPTRPIEVANVDAHGLAEELRHRLKGEVRFDDGSRALYATDASNYRQVPIGVVMPRDVEDVIEMVAAARRFGAPVLGRGGGTSLCGQCCNVAVVLDFSKYMRSILELDPARKRARVQPGCVLDFLRGAAEKHHLTFGPDPSTHNHCTLGGMIGNNSCGVHSVMAGKTDDNVEELDVLLYDGTRMRVGKHPEEELEGIIRGGGRRGEIYARLKAFRDKYADLIRAKFPDIPRRVSGYNLPWLLPEKGFDVAKALVGSECTLILVLEATVRLVWSPPARSLLVLGYPDVYHAGDHIPEVLEAKPVGLEGMDDRLVKDMKAMHIHPDALKLLPKGAGWLLVEFGAETKQEADAQAHRLMDRLQKQGNPPSMKLYDKEDDEKKIWTVRRSGLGATAHVPQKKITWEGWEDSSVPPEKVGRYLRDLRKLLDKFDYACDLYGHFGQGCIHTRIDFDLETAEGIQTFRRFLDEAADLVVSYGGSLSGEHGDGQSKAAMLPKMYGPEMIRAFEEFKAIWDPAWKMNPGKVVRPYDPTQNLRLGTAYHPPAVQTHFHFPADRDNFGRVTLRCVGVGECRRVEGGTMCPSYRVTHEEMHSTRGRAHLLFEMLQGNPLGGGWKSEPVREALDLCLACKGCKSDCPVNVDMATYKAEFLSHYYEGRLRPRHAYSMGLIYWWARLAAYAPGLVNLIGEAPVLRNLVKWMGGIASQRRMPAFAPQTFKEWFRRRGPRNEAKPQVILWPDTFNNHFHPEVGKATVEVLEAAGFQVLVPVASLCCGRPLYDFGMVDTAKSLLRGILETLRPYIRAGIPVVGMEPSCVAVFRDELTSLFPKDEDAKRLEQQTFLLSEFLNKKVDHYQPPRLQRKALVHVHCHHKAVMKLDDEQAVLEKLGLDFQVLDDGCCGMAGSFGFEREHYETSVAVGELALLPAVRHAPKDELIIANGFSCIEQVAQTTDRQPLHLAQVIQMALHDGPHGPAGDYPESHYPKVTGQAAASAKTVALIGAGLLFGGLLLWQRRRKLAHAVPSHSRQPLRQGGSELDAGS
ncbi:MAG TPA: FAD-linked oxidase C-terminal domain-containing protein [Gemmataceae bacterium]|nr:FAD-linked oxidase C-terminal domain-containing protein [Gemmataceae bacterium]